MVRLEDGREIRVRPAFAGAEGRYEDWVYLNMIEREWKRPLPVSDERDEPGGPSPRAAVVLLFWTYFETRIERLLRGGMRNVPDGLTRDTLKRYASIGTRLHQLYQVLFDTTYFKDVKAVGFSDVAGHLERVHKQRNDFAHGHPGAITDELVARVVEMLKREHEAWIAVFNKRSTRLKPQ